MSTNTLAEKDRITVGKLREAEILAMLNEIKPVLWGTTLHTWTSSSFVEDVHDKVDAWCWGEDEGDNYSVQIKYRDVGSDLGIAVIRPWLSNYKFILDRELGTTKWDRDMKGVEDIYVCLIGKTLVVVSSVIVKKAVSILLDKLAAAGGFSGRRFAPNECPGAELRLVTDRGSSGYSAGQEKVICYISPQILRAGGAFIYNVT